MQQIEFRFKKIKLVFSKLIYTLNKKLVHFHYLNYLNYLSSLNLTTTKLKYTSPGCLIEISN